MNTNEDEITMEAAEGVAAALRQMVKSSDNVTGHMQYLRTRVPAATNPASLAIITGALTEYTRSLNATVKAAQALQVAIAARGH